MTGAASGIGRATVDLYRERGWRVVALDLNGAGLRAMEGEDGIATIAGSIADEGVNVAAVALALERFGRLDAAVLNAGVGGGPPLDHPDAITHLDRILAVNLRGTALGIRAALPAFRAGGGGSVVVTSSVAGLRGDPTTWAYNTAKAGLINLVRALAVDHAHENIRINTLAPGFTRTGLTAGAWQDEASSARLISRVPLLRWSEPREQAEVIWFLTSAAASYVTGAVFVADGGVSASNGVLDPPGR